MIYLRIGSDAAASKIQALLRESGMGPCVRCESENELKQLLLLRDSADGDKPATIVRDVEPNERELELNPNATSLGDVRIETVTSPEPVDAGDGALGASLLARTSDSAEFLSAIRFALARDKDRGEIRRLERELSRALKHSSARPDLKEANLLAMLEREWKRCLRYDKPLSVIELRWPDPDSLEAPALVELLADTVHRPGDALGVLSRTGRSVATAVLSETDAAGALHVCERMRQKAQQAHRAVPQIGYATLRPRQAYRMQHGEPLDRKQGAEMLLALADRALEYAGASGIGSIVRWPPDADEQTALDT